MPPMAPEMARPEAVSASDVRRDRWLVGMMNRRMW